MYSTGYQLDSASWNRIGLAAYICDTIIGFFFSGKYGGPEKGLCFVNCRPFDLSTFSSDSPGQLNVLGHDGHPLGVDGAQVGVLKQTNEVGLAGLLQSHNSWALEPQVSLEVLGNLQTRYLI